MKITRRGISRLIAWFTVIAAPAALALLMTVSFTGMVRVPVRMDWQMLVCNGQLLVVDQNFIDDFGLDWDFSFPAPSGSSPGGHFDTWNQNHITFFRLDSFQRSLLVRPSMVSKRIKRFPLWPVLVVAALPLVWKSRRARKQRRERRRDPQGVYCPGCGYDVRATLERCPECGHEMAKAGC